MSDLKQTFTKLADQARKQGAQVELLIDSGDSLSLGAQKSKLEKFDQKTYQTAGFRVIYKGQQGYASTENLSEESLERTFAAALQNVKDLAQANASDNSWKLATEADAFKQIHELDFGDQGTLEQKIQMALEIEKLTLAQDPRISLVPYSSVSEGTSSRRILNSEGLDRSYSERQFVSYSYPMAKSGEQTKMLGESIVSRRLKDLDLPWIAKEAAKRATEMLGAQKLETGKYPLVLDREVAQQMLGLLKAAVSAKRIFEKKSPLVNKLGQSIAINALTVYDDPLDLRGGGARPFDAEGSPSQKVTVIEKGILKNYLTDREYAAKMKLPLTAHASRSATSEMGIGGTTFIFPTGKDSVQALLARYPKMIHVVDLSAFHSGYSPITGDFSLPGQGFLYENGKKVKPVDQFVMSGNLIEMLKQIEGFSNQLGALGSGVICADVLIKELSFA